MFTLSGCVVGGWGGWGDHPATDGTDVAPVGLGRNVARTPARLHNVRLMQPRIQTAPKFQFPGSNKFARAHRILQQVATVPPSRLLDHGGHAIAPPGSTFPHKELTTASGKLDKPAGSSLTDSLLEVTLRSGGSGVRHRPICAGQ